MVLQTKRHISLMYGNRFVEMLAPVWLEITQPQALCLEGVKNLWSDSLTGDARGVRWLGI